MSHIRLKCTVCSYRQVADMATLTCRECSSPLNVEYIGVSRPVWSTEVSEFSPILSPIHDFNHPSILLVNETPFVELPSIAKHLGLDNIFGKLEYLTLTGSYKDRGMAVMVAVAREFGVKELVEDSSGNAGAALAAHASRAGIKAHVFVPTNVSAAKLRQIKAYGAEIHMVDGPRDFATIEAVSYSKRLDLPYSFHGLSPYFLEGNKTFAYETAHWFDNSLPDHIVFPVGNGGLFLGAWMGFNELLASGFISDLPQLHAVQSRNSMPLVAAHQALDWTYDETEKTIAAGIAVKSPGRMQQLLDALCLTHGETVAVDDTEILRWHNLLAVEEGIYAEPTSVAAFAGLDKLVRCGVIQDGERVMIPITGNGLKDVISD